MTALRRHRFTIWLALAGLVYRALIPSGFMPASGAQAQTGAVMVMCPGGMLMPAEPDAKGKPQAFHYAQCPFAVAIAPALPSVLVLPPALAALYAAMPAPGLLSALPAPAHTHPPARGPPSLS